VRHSTSRCTISTYMVTQWRWFRIELAPGQQIQDLILFLPLRCY
jgi:hypothetical protein